MMKASLTFSFLIIALMVYGQQSNEAFLTSDQGVSRKEVRTVQGATFKLERENQDSFLTNGDIKLVNSDENGKVVWTKYYGGNGYEYIGSILKVKNGGYLIVGTISSFGKGNNDAYVVRTDDEGETTWKRTYGGFFNEYGRYAKELFSGNFLIQGQRQTCKGKNVGNCEEFAWTFGIDSIGEILER